MTQSTQAAHATWYLASLGGIQPVTVAHQTGASIVILRTKIRTTGLDAEMRVTASEPTLVEEKVRIKSAAGHYFRTWKEAHDSLVAEAEARLQHARRQLQLAQSLHGNVKGMKPPTDT